MDHTKHATRRYTFTGTPWITADEIADRWGILGSSVRSQIARRLTRKGNPIDLRVPPEQRPVDLHPGTALYWRHLVEEWEGERAEHRAKRDARAATKPPRTETSDTHA